MFLIYLLVLVHCCCLAHKVSSVSGYPTFIQSLSEFTLQVTLDLDLEHDTITANGKYFIVADLVTTQSNEYNGNSAIARYYYRIQSLDTANIQIVVPDRVSEYVNQPVIFHCWIASEDDLHKNQGHSPISLFNGVNSKDILVVPYLKMNQEKSEIASNADLKEGPKVWVIIVIAVTIAFVIVVLAGITLCLQARARATDPDPEELAGTQKLREKMSKLNLEAPKGRYQNPKKKIRFYKS